MSNGLEADWVGGFSPVLSLAVPGLLGGLMWELVFQKGLVSLSHK